ncbi:hypothetical protein AMECASPLE_022839, partial [Ameca splendens]
YLYGLLVTDQKRSRILQEGEELSLSHLFRTPPGCLLQEVYQAPPIRRSPAGQLRTCWEDCVLAGLDTPLPWNWRCLKSGKSGISAQSAAPMSWINTRQVK